MPVTKADIEAKRDRVRQAYAEHGFHSTEYQTEFDELSDMCKQQMAEQFRHARGQPPDARTPYCPRPVAVASKVTA